MSSGINRNDNSFSSASTNKDAMEIVLLDQPDSSQCENEEDSFSLDLDNCKIFEDLQDDRIDENMKFNGRDEEKKISFNSNNTNTRKYKETLAKKITSSESLNFNFGKNSISSNHKVKEEAQRNSKSTYFSSNYNSIKPQNSSNANIITPQLTKFNNNVDEQAQQKNNTAQYYVRYPSFFQNVNRNQTRYCSHSSIQPNKNNLLNSNINQNYYHNSVFQPTPLINPYLPQQNPQLIPQQVPYQMGNYNSYTSYLLNQNVNQYVFNPYAQVNPKGYQYNQQNFYQMNNIFDEFSEFLNKKVDHAKIICSKNGSDWLIGLITKGQNIELPKFSNFLSILEKDINTILKDEYGNNFFNHLILNISS